MTEYIFFSFSLEKKLYYERRAEAKADPETKLSVILDGMDQAKTYIPHFRGWSAPKVSSLIIQYEF